MDGYTATSKLRAMPQYVSLPIVALTAGAMVEDKRRCFAAGMNAYVTKPVRLEALYEQLLLCVPDKAPPVQPATAPNNSPSPDKLPSFMGIDVPLGLAHVGGRLPLFLRLLKKFRDNHGATFESNFSAAVQAQDWEAAYRYAHSLKGVSRTLGAHDLAISAQELETALERRDEAALQAHLQQTRHHLHMVIAGLSALDAAAPAAVQNPSAIATADLLAQLQQLADMLAAHDTQALELAQAITPAIRALPQSELWVLVQDAVEQYQFAKAARELQRLRQDLQLESDGAAVETPT